MSPRGETSGPGLLSRCRGKKYRCINETPPKKAPRSKSTTILSPSGCPFCKGDFRRSSSKPLWLCNRLSTPQTAPTRNTAISNQARHQCKVPAGRKSKMAKMAGLQMTPRISLKVNMSPRWWASELKPDLHLQTPIVGVLGKSFAIKAASHLIREAEKTRSDVADNRPGVGVVQGIAGGHADGQIVSAPGVWRADDIAHRQSATGQDWIRRPRARPLTARGFR